MSNSRRGSSVSTYEVLESSLSINFERFFFSNFVGIEIAVKIVTKFHSNFNCKRNVIIPVDVYSVLFIIYYCIIIVVCYFLFVVYWLSQLVFIGL